MAEEDLKRKLAAVFSADVVEYSRLMREDEKGTIQQLTTCRGVMTELIKQHDGRVVDSVGDNLLAEFASVVDAVQGAVAIQKEIKALNARKADNRRMIFRIGINLGDIVAKGDRIYGDGVNIAARLEALADPGGICISKTAYDQIEDKLPLGYEYLGEKILKNIVKPIQAYRVLFEPEVKTKDSGRAESHIRRSVIGKIKGGAKRTQTKPLKHEAMENLPDVGGRNRFRTHLMVFSGVIVFFALINLFTWVGVVWFQWPVLFLGLIQWFVWIKKSKVR